MRRVIQPGAQPTQRIVPGGPPNAGRWAKSSPGSVGFVNQARFDPDSPYTSLRPDVVNGYLRIMVRGHPLADARGRVMAHRAVLYDAIGVGPHRCHWCEWDGLRWDVPQRDPDFLVVDHLDGDSSDNRLSSLAVSCSWCNNNRSVIEQLGIPWSAFKDVAPADRPPLRVTYDGAPTQAALDLARADSPPPSPAPVALPAPRVVPDPLPPRRRWGRHGRQASNEGASIDVIWPDVAELDENGQVREPIRLIGLPAELLEQFPQLRGIDFTKFGR